MSSSEENDPYTSSEEDFSPESSSPESDTENQSPQPGPSNNLQELTYQHADRAEGCEIPQFRPDNVPGLRLPEDRTKKDSAKYSTPGAFFKLFFTMELVGQVCQYTNNNFIRIGHTKPSLAKNWSPLTEDEFYVFVALLMYMSLVRLPRLDLYWSTQQLFHGFWARTFMSKFRFKQIQAFLKVSNPATEVRGDKLCKVRFLHEYIRRKCMKLWQPHEQISVDERMVPNKGRYGFRQYIKDKPTKWGMKIWVLADGITGFTCNFDLYLGREQGRSEFGLGYDVVFRLCRHLFGMGYKLFVDNFYSSVRLFRDLLANGMTACGTILPNRVEFPVSMKNTKAFNKRTRGAMRWVRVGKTGFLQWKDNKVVSFVTTMHRGINSRVFCRRRTKVNGVFRKLDVSQPVVIQDYNKYMGGVDRSDQMISKFKTLRRTSKYWKTIFYHMLDIAKVNSLIMFREYGKLEKNATVEELQRPKSYSQFEFTVELIKELGKIEVDKEVPLYKVKKLSHPVIPSVSNARRNCVRCYRLEKIERKASTTCLNCHRHFCFSKKRNCLLLDHPV